jgi:hypothetical protein
MTIMQPPRRLDLPEEAPVPGRQRPPWLLPVAALVVAFGATFGGIAVLGGDDPASSSPGQPGDTVPPTGPAGDGQDTGTDTRDSSGTGDSSGSGSGSSSDSAKDSSGDSGSVTTKVTGMTSLSAGAATAQLRAAGVTPSGTVRDATSWTDRNGRNLLVASRSEKATTDAQGLVWRTGTIRVVHVARLGTSNPTVLRTMTDPSGDPCEFDFSHDISRDYGIGGDLNGDGYAEVTVSWFSACRSDPGTFLVKTALLSNGSKYILRGTGWVQGPPDAPGDWPAAEIQQTEPAASAWPAGFRTATRNVFLRLFS